MAIPVYIVDRPRSPARPLTLIEAVIVAFVVGDHFAPAHQTVPPGSYVTGFVALGLYVAMHGLRATVWMVALLGMGLWGWIGYGIAHSIWPGHWIAEGVCVYVGGALSLGEKVGMFAASRVGGTNN